MFRLKIFVRVQTFRRVPPVLPRNFCHPDEVSDFYSSLLQPQTTRNCNLYFQISDLKSERETKNDNLEMMNFCNYWQCPSGDSVGCGSAWATSATSRETTAPTNAAGAQRTFRKNECWHQAQAYSWADENLQILSSNTAILVKISTRITEFSPRNL